MIRKARCFFVVFAVAMLCSSLASAKVNIGEKVTEFALADARTGKDVALREVTGPQGVALIFVATQCPYSNAFNKLMADLAREYKARGIAVVGINANSTEPVEEVKRHAESHGLDFIVLKDKAHGAAEQLGATRTPEVFLLDKDLVLCYHGAIGNSKMPTTKPEETKADDLRPALDAVLKGVPPVVTETKAFGCMIKR